MWACAVEAELIIVCNTVWPTVEIRLAWFNMQGFQILKNATNSQVVVIVRSWHFIYPDITRGYHWLKAKLKHKAMCVAGTPYMAME